MDGQKDFTSAAKKIEEAQASEEDVKNLEFFNFNDASESEENAKFSRLAMVRIVNV